MKKKYYFLLLATIFASSHARFQYKTIIKNNTNLVLDVKAYKGPKDFVKMTLQPQQFSEQNTGIISFIRIIANDKNNSANIIDQQIPSLQANRIITFTQNAAGALQLTDFAQ